MRRLFWTAGLFFLAASTAAAQPSSQIFGKVTDTSGAIMPGVAVTVSASVLLEPRVAITSETGTYQFPGLPIGTYSVRFELTGFGTQVREGVQLQVGTNAQVNAEMQIASLQENVVVTGENPMIDVRSTTQGATFTTQEMQALPSARDVFHVVSLAPSVVPDRQNVGGSTNGQQTGFMSRGSGNFQARWFVDGVDQTDLAQGRPLALDFNAVAEVQFATGGADVTMQTPGITVNVITKSGGDVFRGAAWSYFSDRRLGSNNMSDELWRLGASAGAPLMSAKDFGGQLGGPLKQGRAWFWGTHSRQRIRLGVLNHFKKEGECARVGAAPTSFSFPEVLDCVNENLSQMPFAGFKVGVRPFSGNHFTAGGWFGIRIESVRGSDDLHPFDTTTTLTVVKRSDSTQDLGLPLWDYGVWSPSWKFGDTHTVTNRWLIEAGYGHYCYCGAIKPQSAELQKIQPMTELSSGLWARSSPTTSIFYYRRDNVDLSTTYFLPGRIGGDHSLKAGYKFARFPRLSDLMNSGNAVARFNSGALPAFTTPFSALLARDRAGRAYFGQNSVYLQDTYTRDRLTLIVGLRWDRQVDNVPATVVPAHPFQGQATINGTTFNLLPAINAAAVDAGVVWNAFAPRFGFTYDVSGNARNVIKGSYAIYFDQRSEGMLSQHLSPATAAQVELAWTDLNADKVVQANEVDPGRIISFSGFDPANPTLRVSNNRVDPDVSAPRTDEIVVGFGQELPGEIGWNLSYVWRKYTNFIWQDRIGLTSANYAPVTFIPPAATCPAGARCEAVTYYAPNVPVPSDYIATNQADFNRVYDGIEFVVRKRSSRGWMAMGSVAYNSTVEHYDSANAYEDPTNISLLNGAQYSPTTGFGGGGNVAIVTPLNARWVVHLNGSYQLPYRINFAATADLRQGYPFLQAVNIATRPNRAPGVAVLLDPPGEVRLPDFATIDLRVDRTFSFGRFRIQPTLDVFNLLNASTVLGRRTNQNASNANRIYGILGPRSMRIGGMLTF